jgi:Skp family chaperone for outer membrane proteins
MNPRALLKNFLRPLLVLSLLTGPVCAADAKFAVVDVNLVMNKYYKTKEQEVRINEQGARFKMDLDKISDERQDISRKIRTLRQEEQDESATQTERATIRKQITELSERLFKLDSDYKAKLQEGNQKLRNQQNVARQGLVGEVIKTIRTTARKQDLEIVIDKSSVNPGGAPVLPYTSDGVDITEEVIKILNAGKK